MPLLTDEQLERIKKIIADRHTAFVATAVAPGSVPADKVEELKRRGLIKNTPPRASIKDAYLMGQVLAHTNDPKVKDMTYRQLKNHIERHPVPITDYEERAIKMAERQAGEMAVGLGNRVDQKTGRILIEADHNLRQKTRDTIKDKVAENIEERESVAELKSALGYATEDWARDWQRIAQTEKQNAMQLGVADAIHQKDGGEARVAKRVAGDCCDHCRRIWVGPDGAPRIFTLDYLMANGSNHGVKAADWKPTVFATHPNCRCQLINIPVGWGFDDTGRLTPSGELGVQYGSDDDDASFEKAWAYEEELRKAAALGGDLVFQGIPITIESDVGSVRRWVDESGTPGSTQMMYAYGFIQGVDGLDGDELDCYIGPDRRARFVYVVHQQGKTNGLYDELKCFLGFSSEADARRAFLQHADPRMFVSMDVMPLDRFKQLYHEEVTPKPLAQTKERFFLKSDPPPLGITTVQALDHASTRGGTSPNYVTDTPPYRQTSSRTEDTVGGFDEFIKRKKKPGKKEKRQALYRKKKDWSLYPRFAPDRPFQVPQTWQEDRTSEQEKGADRFDALMLRRQQRIAVVRNTVDLADSAMPK